MSPIALLAFLLFTASTFALPSSQFPIPIKLPPGTLPAIGPTKSNHTVWSILSTNPQFTKFAGLLCENETLLDFLDEKKGGEWTVFAPNDDAFPRHHPREYPHPGWNRTRFINRILAYHILPHAYNSSHIHDHLLNHHNVLKTILHEDALGGGSQVVRMVEWERKHWLEGGELEDPDTEEGYFWNVDEDDADEEWFPRGLDHETPEAEAPPKAHHRDLFVNGYSVVRRADIHASNGVIHEVSRVLLPPPPPTVVLRLLRRFFAGMSYAIRRAELTGLVDHTKSITVFAPTTRAFFKTFSIHQIRYLFSPLGFHHLRRIILGHVIMEPRVVYERYFWKAGKGGNVTMETAGEEAVVARVVNGKVRVHTLPRHQNFVDTADIKSINEPPTVVFADIPIRNGIMHAIDRVLVPPGLWKALEDESGQFEEL